ncbi:MAG: metallophosphoesterase [Chlorobiaceae bacterium]|nr:metallophosphoesterase [Chlorobiaceae bacterium]
MKKYFRRRYPELERLMESARPVPIDNSSRVVVFSDLHMGDGSRKDEFLRNSELLETVLENHYLTKRFSLVLNGDIEELMKFTSRSIERGWGRFYDLFLRFRENGFFWKIYGNHDLGLLQEKGYRLMPWLVESIAFRYGVNTILLFHGHQASEFLKNPCSLISRLLFYLLRYIAKPAGIRNYSVSHKSRKRYAIEQAVYDFSNRTGIISIIGHTHRPLFESLSKVDYLNYHIEDLCRAYPSADPERRVQIETEIGSLKDELDACYRKGFRKSLRTGRYANLTIPSIFNSGCAIGKRGVTAIEIEDGMIRLVYWHKGLMEGGVSSDACFSEELGKSGFFRVVLNEDRLDYVFSRIRLLSRSQHESGAYEEEALNVAPTFI